MQTKKNIITMGVHITSMQDCLMRILHAAKSKQAFNVCVSNVHMCIECFDNQHFNSAVNNANMVIPDGKPIYWAQKLFGAKESKQIRGMDLTLSLCELAEQEKLSIGFLGGAQSTLDKLSANLKQQFPALNIGYMHSPPFRALSMHEHQKIISNIENSGIRVLFVGLGCPKQELWMSENKKHLNCVMLGVGAAFDFIAGDKKHAPEWMQAVGLEWLYRLLSEPKRLWRRYLYTNPKFIYLFISQLLGRKF